MRNVLALASALSISVLAACAQELTTPDVESVRPETLATSQSGNLESSPFNNQIILRGDGSGLVKFRQPDDDEKIVFLDVKVRHLAPNTEYLLQRAVDTTIDDNCTSSGWLTLGLGTTPRTILTDSRGFGDEALFRDLGATPEGMVFDIHFRVIEAATSAVVLTSDCYQFTVRE